MNPSTPLSASSSTSSLRSPSTVSLDQYVTQQFPYETLPPELVNDHQLSRSAYYSQVLRHCVDRQIRFEKTVLCAAEVMREREYYVDMMRYLQKNLRLYPYQFSHVVVNVLKILPFQYYVDMLHQIMTSEKAYDVLPNFTAADVHRLMGIGRNQFIDIMNQVRSKRWAWKLNKKHTVREFLPVQCRNIEIDYWWIVEYNEHMSQQEFIKVYNSLEDEDQKLAIGMIKKESQVLACRVPHHALQELYKKGLVRLEVPILGDDYIVVPPLKNFIMNRAPNDPFEKLLYDVLVTFDERTSVAELAVTLEVAEERVRQAVSICCRLDFAKKRLDKPTNIDDNIGDQFHRSWKSIINAYHEVFKTDSFAPVDASLTQGTTPRVKRIGFLFDSSLTAYLMMGNLAEGLKNHAVTLFEVGKLQDEMLDSFLLELDKIKTSGGEGEARRYYQHALALRRTLRFLRHNDTFAIPDCDGGVDMVRCESLNNLDPGTKLRLLDANYSAIITMAPLAPGSLNLPSSLPNFYGYPVQQVASPWFKLYMYSLCGMGPNTILYPKGARLRKLPSLLQQSHKVLLSAYDQDHVVTSSNILLQVLNDALVSHPNMVQINESDETIQTVMYNVPFPLCYESFDEYQKSKQHMLAPTPSSAQSSPRSVKNVDALGFEMPSFEDEQLEQPDIESEEEFARVQEIVNMLVERLHLELSFGFVRIMKSVRRAGSDPDSEQDAQDGPPEEEKKKEIVQLVPFDLHIGIPLSNEAINQSVCDAISKGNLLQEENIAKNSKNMHLLVDEFLNFVDNQVDGQLRMSSDSHVIYPTRAIHFDGSELQQMSQ